jgi:beta-lactamase class A
MIWGQSRREILALSAAAAVGGLMPSRTMAARTHDSKPGNSLAREIVDTFRQLPGQQALEIWAPATSEKPPFKAIYNADKALFCASSFKAFVLAKFLQDIDAERTELNKRLVQEITLDKDVWSPGAPVFNPPKVTGQVQLRAAIDAMIGRSDNTATDMMLKHVGAERVRDFIRSAGFKTARIPTSTRIFFAYLLGAKNYRTITWDQLMKLTETDAPFVNPPINDVETMVCSPHDFVTFYEQALNGKFFKNEATLSQFKSTLMLADAIPLVAPPATTFYMKGGSLDAELEHALSIAGGLFIPERWVYFALIVNWKADTADAGPVLDQFAGACKTIFTAVKERLGTC